MPRSLPNEWSWCSGLPDKWADSATVGLLYHWYNHNISIAPRLQLYQIVPLSATAGALYQHNTLLASNAPTPSKLRSEVDSFNIPPFRIYCSSPVTQNMRPTGQLFQNRAAPPARTQICRWWVGKCRHTCCAACPAPASSPRHCSQQ